ncbi:MAG: DDE-type integrase/transposase/recombinase, partial [Myxococcales bacterium]|nr:DDE-type integrase/transposase/recombinase [Myxococcales bacterium]
AWMRSRLPASEFATLVGLSAATLYQWKKRFEARGPAGLEDGPRGRKGGSRLAEPIRRAIVMLKRAHPDWGQDRIHDVLLRSEGYGASPGAVALVLEEEGYVVEEAPTVPHEAPVRRFERARPNELWQTDLFTFLLKRENRRVHLVAFMDDHSRFIVGYGLHASASGALVREVLEAAIGNFGAPLEVLTDNGTQYKTWRGVSEFTQLLTRRGIRHVVASPRRPQTLGKAERFWGTLWRELLEKAIFQGLDDARRRIGLFIDHYNFQRPHQGIGGAVPADRYFEAAAEVKATLLARVASNAEELARNGVPRKPFYLTGRVGDRDISLHAEGEKVVLVEGGQREEVDLGAPGRRAETEAAPALPEPVAVTAVVTDATDLDEPAETPPAPGTSPLDASLSTISRVMAPPSRPDPVPPAPPAPPAPAAPRAPYAPGGAS